MPAHIRACPLMPHYTAITFLPSLPSMPSTSSMPPMSSNLPYAHMTCRFRRPRLLLVTFTLIFVALFAPAARAADDVLRIGSKRFTESCVLGEIVRQTAAPLAHTEHRQGLGNTAILFNALKSGSIDVYPDYLGTIALEILKQDRPGTLEEIDRALAPMGLGVAVPLGFNNSYGLAMRGSDAARHRAGSADVPGSVQEVSQLSALATLTALKFGLSHEFIGRADGWPGLARRYGLPQSPRGLDHGIAYQALVAGQVDVIDIYSTDAKIARLGLRVLDDDKAYFPRYDAVLLYRRDLPQRFPAAWKAISALQGRIDEKAMIAMNGQAELDAMPFDRVAREFLARDGKASSAGTQATPDTAVVATEIRTATETETNAGTKEGTPATEPGAVTSSSPSPQSKAHMGMGAGLAARLFDDDLWRLTRQHASLVFVSVFIATLAGIPLGLLAAARPLPRQTVMALVGILQTIPSLALLAMLIPLLGMIGAVPAQIALCLYALLPIVRNTCTGLQQVSPGLRQAALALGLTKRQRLLLVDLPLALPVILAGLKTAAVMSVGTATIAAFIGAGGYGERISIGLALSDNAMLLAGALPAAVLALLMQGGFELLEWALLRRRQRSARQGRHEESQTSAAQP